MKKHNYLQLSLPPSYLWITILILPNFTSSSKARVFNPVGSALPPDPRKTDMSKRTHLAFQPPGDAALYELSGFCGLPAPSVGGARPRREAERTIWAVGEFPWTEGLMWTYRSRISCQQSSVFFLLRLSLTTLRMNGCRRYSMLGCSIRDQTLMDVVPITWIAFKNEHNFLDWNPASFYHVTQTSFFEPSFLFLSITFTLISSV